MSQPRTHNPGARRRDRERLTVVVAAIVIFALLAGVVIYSAHRHNFADDDPPLPLTGEITLEGWKLSIPEQNDKGEASSIEPAMTKEPWLTRDPDGGLEFWAPTTGATTRNSAHPRTELLSLTDFRAGTERHSLAASLTLLQLPQDGRGIILGQIHGAGDIRSVPYVMLRVQNNQLRVVVKQARNRDNIINYPLLDDVGLNTRIDYTITDRGDSTMTFSATSNGVTHRSAAPVPSAFRGATVRFQAGDYQQANVSRGPQDGGRVIFHQLIQR